MAFPRIKNRYAAAILASMGSVLMGSVMAFTSPTISQISQLFSMSSIQETMFNVCATICATAGSLFINIFVPKLGRRISAVITGAAGFAFYLGLSWSNTMWVAYLMRCCLGVTAGFCSTVFPTWVCELAPVEKRGLFGYVNQLTTAIGFAVPTCFGFGNDWRLTARLCSIFPGLSCIVSIFLPDLRKDKCPFPNDPEPLPPLTSERGFCAVFEDKKSVLISLCLMFFLQFCGVQAIISNLEPIITQANLGINPSIIAVCANIAQLISNVIAAFIVDGWGRQPCWILSSAGQLVAFILLTAYDLAGLPTGVFIAALFCEQLFFGIGTGPIPFMRTAEIFSDAVRSSAMALMTAVNWAFVVIVVFIWPYMRDGMGLGYAFLFYACLMAVAIIFGVFALPRKSRDRRIANISSQELDSSTSEDQSRESKSGSSTSNKDIQPGDPDP